MTETKDLLFEIGTEELPPMALKRLSGALSENFLQGLEKADLKHGPLTAYATPRRLAIMVRDCAVQQPDREIERRGPAVQAAFDAGGEPTKAAEGFARSCGTTVDQLTRQKTDKGEWLSFCLQEKGKSSQELLPEIAENALHHLPIPKRMRWADSEAQFVRPVHWLVFLQGEDIVPCRLLDVDAGNRTRGHRFHQPEEITISRPEEYANALQQQGDVIPDFGQRREQIWQQVEQAAQDIGAEVHRDDDLLDEVCALVEWPRVVMAGFEEKYLQVPHEILAYTMKKNQKYFPLFRDGKLINHFITVANIDSREPDVIRHGNERVIRPRLADAMFFWEQDGKRRLESHLDALSEVVFEQKLGTLADKSQRVETLAGRIARGMNADVDLAQRAARLSRCDLMTETVGEFPEMQGVMGRYQARRDGEAEELAQALDEFYMPRFAGDRLPETRTGIAVALAERLDTLMGIFGIGMRPTGDKDPYALRRAAIGALRILKEHTLPFDLLELLEIAANQLQDKLTEAGTAEVVFEYLLDRLKGIYLEEQVPVEIFDAVVEVQPRNIADFDQRIHAVLAFWKLAEAQSLSAANKRIRNILKKSGDSIPDTVDTQTFQQAEETALYSQLVAVEKEVEPLLQEKDYETAMIRMAALRDTVDTFFDEVMVMTEDQVVRSNRLALLFRLSDLFLEVADISCLSGKAV